MTTLFVFTMVVCNGQGTSNTIMKDFMALTGNWQGSLTYLDYTSGKPYTMPAEVKITTLQNTVQFTFANTYPKEPGANSVDTLTISADGQYIDKGRVKTRNLLSNGDIEIVTEQRGTDGNDHKQATFRYTYLMGKSHFSKRKDVQFEGETKWIKRHEFSYTRKPDS